MSDEIDELRSRLSDALLTIERLDAEIKTLQINQGAQSFMSFKIGSDSDNNPYPVPRAPFSVYYIDSSWKMYFPLGSFTYAGFAPSTVTPAVSSEYVPITWISSGNGAVYAHVQASVAEDGSISACDSISFDDTAANPAAGENKKTVTFKVAVVTDYLVDQVALGAMHFMSSSGGTVTTDEKSTGKNESQQLEIYKWKTQTDETSTLADAITADDETSASVVVRYGGPDGTLKYLPIGIIGKGETNYASFIGDIRYNIEEHHLEKRIDTLNMVTGAVTLGNYECILNGKATPHMGELT